jgi:AcrR family transcriptional regulator
VQTKEFSQAEKIVEAASHLFGTQRFHEVRMDDVAAAADVGKGTLYRYFRDKEELYAGLLAHATAQFRERMRAEVDKVAGARARLEALVQAIVDYFDEHPHLKGLIQRAEAVHDEGKKPFVWNEARAEALRMIQTLFEQGRLQGEFTVRDPVLAAMLLLGGIRSVVRDGVHPRPVRLARQVVENFLWGSAQ